MSPNQSWEAEQAFARALLYLLLAAVFLPLLMFALTGCGTYEAPPAPCTTYTDEYGVVVACPDGSQSRLDSGSSGKDGKDGKDGKPGQTGPAGRDGTNGRDGKDAGSGSGSSEGPSVGDSGGNREIAG